MFVLNLTMKKKDVTVSKEVTTSQHKCEEFEEKFDDIGKYVDLIKCKKSKEKTKQRKCFFQNKDSLKIKLFFFFDFFPQLF